MKLLMFYFNFVRENLNLLGYKNYLWSNSSCSEQRCPEQIAAAPIVCCFNLVFYTVVTISGAGTKLTH
jgi:hypothetical protein